MSSRLTVTLELGIIWLSESPQILHRDVSINNVMYRRRGNVVIGVLNDFDLAAPTIPVLNPHLERTGTLPFMSIDVLRNHPPAETAYSFVHHVRHDLESLYWVLTWHCSRHPYADRGKDHLNISDWTTWDMASLADKKRNYLERQPYQIPIHLTPTFEFTRPWLEWLRTYIVTIYALSTTNYAQNSDRPPRPPTPDSDDEVIPAAPDVNTLIKRHPKEYLSALYQDR